MAAAIPVFAPCVKVLPTYAVGYSKALSYCGGSLVKMPMLNSHGGYVSDKAATKIRNAVNWMLFFTSKKRVYSLKERSTFYFYLNFITLTLPSEQKHTDDYIKDKMLVPFLEWMCRTKGASMWLWKAECQGNGNIHFHITSHIFIHWKVVRKKWNQILAKNGYCKVYQDGTNDKGNSATQIKAAKSPEHVGGYLAAYIGKDDRIRMKIRKPLGLPKIKSTTKADDARNYCYGIHSVLKRKVDGRLWACSTNLSNINCSMLGEDVGYKVDDVFNDLMNSADKIQNEKYYSILMYRHLKFKKLPESVKPMLTELITQMNVKEDTKIEVESLFK